MGIKLDWARWDAEQRQRIVREATAIIERERRKAREHGEPLPPLAALKRAVCEASYEGHHPLLVAAAVANCAPATFAAAALVGVECDALDEADEALSAAYAEAMRSTIAHKRIAQPAKVDPTLAKAWRHAIAEAQAQARTATVRDVGIVLARWGQYVPEAGVRGDKRAHAERRRFRRELMRARPTT